TPRRARTASLPEPGPPARPAPRPARTARPPDRSGSTGTAHTPAGEDRASPWPLRDRRHPGGRGPRVPLTAPGPPARPRAATRGRTEGGQGRRRRPHPPSAVRCRLALGAGETALDQQCRAEHECGDRDQCERGDRCAGPGEVARVGTGGRRLVVGGVTRRLVVGGVTRRLVVVGRGLVVARCPVVTRRLVVRG